MTTARGPVLVIGEALVDIVHPSDGIVTEHVGGSPANVAIGLARLDHPVEFTTWIGTDTRGERIRDHLESNGVRFTYGSQGADRTSTALARLDGDGVADYEFDVLWDPPHPAPSRQPIHLHIGSIGAVMAPGSEVVTASTDDHRQYATISYDPNVRPSLMGAREDVARQVEELVAAADIIKASDEDAAWLIPGREPVELARHWVSLGAAIAVITRGPGGAVAVSAAGHVVEVPSPKVAVADTVGAGDSFMSGLLDGLATADLLGAGQREALRDVAPEVLRAVLARGIAAASITVSREGANPPTTAELDG